MSGRDSVQMMIAASLGEGSLAQRATAAQRQTKMSQCAGNKDVM
jgi:hypothetical protein